MADQNEMEKIVTPMMEHLCDHLCRFLWETERKENLEDICAGCKMGQYVCDILNTYNAACQLQAVWTPWKKDFLSFSQKSAKSSKEIRFSAGINQIHDTTNSQPFHGRVQIIMRLFWFGILSIDNSCPAF